MIKAKKVIEKAPEKFRKRPNLGIIIEKSPVNNTTTLLYIMLLNLGYLECNGSLSKHVVFSDISKAGMTYNG